MGTPKKIVMHPFVNGQKDKTTDLYPKTDIDSVVGLQQALNDKQGELTEEEKAATDSGITAEKVAKYDNYETSKQDAITEDNPLPAEYISGLEEELTSFVKKDTEIGGVEIQDGIDYINEMFYDNGERIIPREEYVDRETYLINFDLGDIYSTFNFEGASVYFISNEDGFEIDVNGDKTIMIKYHGNTYFYRQSDLQWVDSVTSENPHIYTESELEDLEIEFWQECVNKHPRYDTESILRKIVVHLDGTPLREEERVEYDRTLEDVKEDLPNWAYSKESKTFIRYGFENGTRYKLNFDVTDYLNSFNDFRPGIVIYGAPTVVVPNCVINTQPALSTGLVIKFEDGYPEYWFVPDITDTTNYGTWRKGASPYAVAYTKSELEDVRFTYDASKVEEHLLTEFTKMFLDLEGNPVETLVDGTTYKVNFFNVQDYIMLFDLAYSGGRYDLNIYNGDGEDNYIKFVGKCIALNSLCIAVRPTDSSGGTSPLAKLQYYYFYPQIGMTYPGQWYNENEDYSIMDIYNSQDLEDVEFTLTRDSIRDEELLRIITTNLDGSAIAEDSEETIIITTTLKDKLEDYKNWTYENDGVGILDIPKWELFEEASSYRGYIYEKPQHLQIMYVLDTFNSMVEIYDIDNNLGYVIFKEDYETPYGLYEANTWYIWDLISQDDQTKCNTPNFDLEEEYVIDETLLNAVYGEKITTLGQKIDKINKIVNNIEPLKDKVYDGEEGILENGESYSLSDDYTDFFNKYGEAGNTLIYGYPDELEPKSNSGEKGNVAEIGVVTEEPVIIGIYLWTDFLTRDSNEGIKDGGMSLLGGKSIQLTTTQGELTFNEGDTSWTYGKQEIPLEYLPKLVLDTTLIREEEMLKDFLKIKNTKQTLEEKFNEIENAPLKYKMYDVGTSELVNGQNYPFKTNLDDFFNKGYELVDIFNINGGGEVTPVTPVFLSSGAKAPSIEVGDGEREEYVTFITYMLAKGDPVIKVVTNLDEYRYYQTNGCWVNTYKEQVTPPNLVYNSEYVLNEEMLISLLILTKSQTLEEKFNEEIKNWTYEYTGSSSEIEEKVYNVKMAGINIDASSYGTAYLIATDKNEYVILDFYANDNGIICLEYWNRDSGLSLFYNSDDNIWEYANGESYTGETLTFDVDLEGIEDETLLKEILVFDNASITLEDKIKDLPNWEYQDSSVLRPVELPNWQAISELDNWEEDQIIAYMDEEMVHMPAIAIERNVDDYSIRIVDSIDMLTQTGVYYIIASVSMRAQIEANKWYKLIITQGQEGTPIEVSVDDIPDYTFDNLYMLRQDAFDLIYQGKVGTLAEKLDSIEAPYSIVDYQETSGTLESITVKSKETGEETTLNVGGGGVPTITFEVSQIIDSSHIQLTNEQYEIISNNGFVTILFQGAIFGCNVLFLGEAIFLTNYLLGDDVNMAFIVNVDTDTKIGTYSNNILPRAKQLYQHNITCWPYGQTLLGTIKVITDSATPFSANTFKNWLLDNGFNSDQNIYEAIIVVDGHNDYGVIGVYASSGDVATTLRIAYWDFSANTSKYKNTTMNFSNEYAKFSDIVTPL